MNLYRFSPIQSKEKLLEAAGYVHAAAHRLCKQVFGAYLPVAGDLAIFCHYDDEYEFLTNLRQELTDESDAIYNGNYFRLHEPFSFPAAGDVPAGTYTHLYVRKPDPYRSQVGDAGFYLDPAAYNKLKQSLLAGEKKKGIRVFDRPGTEMLELHNPDVDILGYVYPQE